MAPCPPSPCACPLTFSSPPPHPAQLKCPSPLLLSPVGRGRVRGETPSAEQASAPRLCAFRHQRGQVVGAVDIEAQNRQPEHRRVDPPLWRGGRGACVRRAA